MSGVAGAHTPEPWTDGDEAIAVKLDRERPWASTVFRKGHDGSEANALLAMTFGGTADEAVATARRIVACVNALAGIPTEDIPTLLGEVREVLETMLRREQSARQNWTQAAADAQRNGDHSLSVSIRNTALQALSGFPIMEARTLLAKLGSGS